MYNHPLEAIFKANIFKMLKKEGKIGDELINNLMNWKDTGFKKTGTVIYHSKMTHGINKQNFVIYTAEDFIAAICQHIPE